MDLLKQGAVLAASTDDICSEFGWPDVLVASPAAQLQPDLPGLLGELAALIHNRGEPLLDELIVVTGKSAPELLPSLMMLELQGVIQALPSGRYSALGSSR